LGHPGDAGTHISLTRIARKRTAVSQKEERQKKKKSRKKNVNGECCLHKSSKKKKGKAPKERRRTKETKNLRTGKLYSQGTTEKRRNPDGPPHNQKDAQRQPANI